MPPSLAQLPLRAIRDRYVDEATPITPGVLNALKRDPRDGARQLYETLKKRFELQRRERARLDGMLNFERVLWRSGVQHIAGVDEVGIGPLAGPVVAAAVVVPPDTAIDGVDDSKRLEPAQRLELEQVIRAKAAVGIGVVEVDEIDSINVYQAGLLAMQRAVEALPVPPQHVLVDARTIPGVGVPQNPFVKGDGINFSIACASIIAKTYRDRVMATHDPQYPQYGFAQHKGYSTPQHQAAIRRHGPCALHRMSYPVIGELCGAYTPRFYQLRQEITRANGAPALRRIETRIAQSALSVPELKKLKLLLQRRWKGI